MIYSSDENLHHHWLFDSKASTHVIGNHKALGTIKNIGSKTKNQYSWWADPPCYW
jgi:hypothetical protein